MVATVQLKHPVPGVCNDKEIYAMFSGFQGQVKAVFPGDKADLLKKLNEVQAIKDNPKVKGKLMIGCIINCKGELVSCDVDIKSGNKELDEQIRAVFQTFKKWLPGKFNGREVDSAESFSIVVKKGIISFS